MLLFAHLTGFFLLCFLCKVKGSGAFRACNASISRKIHSRAAGPIFEHISPNNFAEEAIPDSGIFAFFVLQTSNFYALHEPTDAWKCKKCSKNFASGDRLFSMHAISSTAKADTKSLAFFLSLHFCHFACGLLTPESNCAQCTSLSQAQIAFLARNLTLEEINTVFANQSNIPKLNSDAKPVVADRALGFVATRKADGAQIITTLKPEKFLAYFFMLEEETEGFCAFESFLSRNIQEATMDDQLIALETFLIEFRPKLALTFLSVMSVEYLDLYTYRKKGLRLLDDLQSDDLIIEESLHSQIMLSTVFANLLLDADKTSHADFFLTKCLEKFVPSVDPQSEDEISALCMLLEPAVLYFTGAPSNFSLYEYDFVRLGDFFLQNICSCMIKNSCCDPENFYFFFNQITDSCVIASVMADAVDIFISEHVVDDFLGQNVSSEDTIRAFLEQAIGNENGRKLFEKYYIKIQHLIADGDQLKQVFQKLHEDDMEECKSQAFSD